MIWQGNKLFVGGYEVGRISPRGLFYFPGPYKYNTFLFGELSIKCTSKESAKREVEKDFREWLDMANAQCENKV